MWSIELVDIAGDGLIAEFETTVESLPEAEQTAIDIIRRKLHIADIRIAHYEDLIYSVWNEENEIGAVRIRSL